MISCRSTIGIFSKIEPADESVLEDVPEDDVTVRIMVVVTIGSVVIGVLVIWILVSADLAEVRIEHRIVVDDDSRETFADIVLGQLDVVEGLSVVRFIEEVLGEIRSVAELSHN